MKKHFNLWLFVTLPFIVFILNQINVVLSITALGTALVWSMMEYDRISYEYDEKEKKYESNSES